MMATHAIQSPTPAEFVSWLEGFVDATGDHGPTAEQWMALRAKLASVSKAQPLGNLWSPSVTPFDTRAYSKDDHVAHKPSAFVGVGY